MRNRTKRKLILFGALVAILLLAAIFAQVISPYDPNLQNYEIALQPPSFAHPFGTDRYGRDMLSRVIAGAQTSIFSTLLLVAVISVFGTLIGVACGYLGGLFDGVVMRISDICLAFPGLVFALAIAAVLNGGIQNAVLALAAISWPKYARLARSQTLSMKNADYMMAARLSGNTPLKMIVRHILPNITGPVLVTAMLDIGTMMMEIAALSFLGLGAKPPTAEWGSMMSGGRSMLQTYPWVVLTPGVAIFISVVLFNLLGDTIRDYLDPRSTHGK
ncbi:MAG TPA: ABC transporter permease [Candidatus Blautia avistercoris]|uniref:nickel transporter permease n=1 Tax=Blautia sp. An249 TaxID=1965603 RepID=UPI000B375E34|nr:nickel transporter permease [Blautia sp. An249]OUO81248.1 nickel ABC transporter permease subunit NikC [Blautia sp. An249]HIY18000.1 ABC transporter permease [Candidatus Blautia avistercoris]